MISCGEVFRVLNGNVSCTTKTQFVQFGHLFAKGESREAAIRAMVVALKEIKIRGEIRTIVDYAIEMIQSPEFVGNEISTGWLDSRIASQVGTTNCPRLLFLRSALAVLPRKLYERFRCWALEIRYGLLVERRTLVLSFVLQAKPLLDNLLPNSDTYIIPSWRSLQVKAEKPVWYISVVAGAILRTLETIEKDKSQFVQYLEKGHMPPSKLNPTSFKDSFVLEGRPDCDEKPTHILTKKGSLEKL